MPQTISMVSGTPFACPNVLFPLVFYWASTWFEEPVGMVADWPRFACFTYVALQMSINFIGLLWIRHGGRSRSPTSSVC